MDEGQVVFGEIGEGLEDILAKINETFVDKSFRPLIDIRINHTIVLDDPFEDPEGMKGQYQSIDRLNWSG